MRPARCCLATRDDKRLGSETVLGPVGVQAASAPAFQDDVMSS